MELDLTAKTPNEKIILDYLKNNISDVLAEKINAGKKTLQGCWNFIVGEAKKKAISGCACIEDKEVFGWAVHYFQEDSIAECKSAPAAKAVTTKAEKKPEKVEKVEAKPKSKKADDGQISFFDMFG